jgi:hypothetical protein
MASQSKKEKQQQSLVRISAADKAVLDELSKKTGESMPRLLHKAVTQLEQKLFCDEINAAYEEMRRNPQLWSIEQDERKLLDNATSDIVD